MNFFNWTPDDHMNLFNWTQDDWKRKEKEGEFVPGRMDDALSRALQRKVCLGRVLIAGHYIGITYV